MTKTTLGEDIQVTPFGKIEEKSLTLRAQVLFMQSHCVCYLELSMMPVQPIVRYALDRLSVKTNVCTLQRSEVGYQLEKRIVPDYNFIFVSRGQVVWVVDQASMSISCFRKPFAQRAVLLLVLCLRIPFDDDFRIPLF